MGKSVPGGPFRRLNRASSDAPNGASEGEKSRAAEVLTSRLVGAPTGAMITGLSGVGRSVQIPISSGTVPMVSHRWRAEPREGSSLLELVGQLEERGLVASHGAEHHALRQPGSRGGEG